jgi:hypothetical protein
LRKESAELSRPVSAKVAPCLFSIRLVPSAERKGDLKPGLYAALRNEFRRLPPPPGKLLKQGVEADAKVPSLDGRSDVGTNEECRRRFATMAGAGRPSSLS